MARLKELGVYDRTLIYVTADHGFDLGAKSHRNAPFVFLATNDPQVMRNGARADITPTILCRLGVPTWGIEPPLDGETLTRPATRPVEPPVKGDVKRPGGQRKPQAAGGTRKRKPAEAQPAP